MNEPTPQDNTKESRPAYEMGTLGALEDMIRNNNDLEQQKVEFEKEVLRKLYEKFPPEEQKLITTIDGIEILACGEEPTESQMETIVSAIEKIKDKIGDSIKLFEGVKLYLVDLGESGGQALGRESVIIVNTGKMGITVGEMEKQMELSGRYRKGDQSSIVGNDADAAEVGIVHEFGHILEFRSYGDLDKAFADLDSSESPTYYGAQLPREDYAESWMYYIYDGPITESRKAIIQSDLDKLKPVD